MKILKSKEFTQHYALTTFINDNNIAREDILIISPKHLDIVIFFYADPEVTEKERNMWGKLKD